jgi:hypothetical protein
MDEKGGNDNDTGDVVDADMASAVRQNRYIKRPSHLLVSHAASSGSIADPDIVQIPICNCTALMRFDPYDMQTLEMCSTNIRSTAIAMVLTYLMSMSKLYQLDFRLRRHNHFCPISNE